MIENKSVYADDKFVVAPRVQTGWGFPIALYLFFSGTGAGLFLFSVIFHSPLGVVLDLFFLGIGVIALFFDLGNPWRFWKAYKKPNTSWISRGTFLITFLFLFDLFYALMKFPKLPLPISLLLGAVAVMVILYPGLVISYSPSIALWNNGLIPILFGLHSTASGLFILFMVHPLLNKRLGDMVGMVELYLVLLFFLLIGMAVFLLVSYVSTSGSKESVRLLLDRKGGFYFLFLGTGLGILLPMALFILLSKGLSSWAIMSIACVGRLIGDFGFRYAILRSGIYEGQI